MADREDRGEERARGAGRGGVADVVLERVRLRERLRVLADDVEIDDLWYEVPVRRAQHERREDDDGADAHE